MGDDGEKFGLWPTTYDHCWTGGWVEEFFAALEQNADWLITCPPGDVLKQVQPIGRAYVPAASYDEMNVWSLPAQPSHDLVEDQASNCKPSSASTCCALSRAACGARSW